MPKQIGSTVEFLLPWTSKIKLKNTFLNALFELKFWFYLKECSTKVFGLTKTNANRYVSWDTIYIGKACRSLK